MTVVSHTCRDVRIDNVTLRDTILHREKEKGQATSDNNCKFFVT